MARLSEDKQTCVGTPVTSIVNPTAAPCGGPSASDEMLVPVESPKKSIIMSSPQESVKGHHERTIFSETELENLETLFCKTKRPNQFERQEIAEKLNLPDSTIKRWFKNRRLINETKKSIIVPSPEENPTAAPCGGPSASDEMLVPVESLEKKSIIMSSPQESVKGHRERTIFSETELENLETLFRKTKLPNQFERQEIAEKLNWPDSTIKRWFKNRRLINETKKSIIVPSPEENPTAAPCGGTSASDEMLVPVESLEKKSIIMSSPQESVKQRRGRTTFSKTQVEIFKTYFDRTKYPTKVELEEIAEKLNLSESNVKTWFKNRRARAFTLSRDRKQHLQAADEEQENLTPNLLTKQQQEPSQQDINVKDKNNDEEKNIQFISPSMTSENRNFSDAPTTSNDQPGLFLGEQHFHRNRQQLNYSYHPNRQTSTSQATNENFDQQTREAYRNMFNLEMQHQLDLNLVPAYRIGQLYNDQQMYNSTLYNLNNFQPVPSYLLTNPCNILRYS